MLYNRGIHQRCLIRRCEGGFDDVHVHVYLATDSMTLSTSGLRLNNAVIYRRKLFLSPITIRYSRHTKCNRYESEESHPRQLSSLFGNAGTLFNYIQASNFSKIHNAVSVSCANSYQILVLDHFVPINGCHPDPILTSSPASHFHQFPMCRLDSRRHNQSHPRLHEQP